MNILILDNYDSFTFNLFHLIGEVTGEPPLVRRNDEVSLGALQRMDLDAVVISPGPGHPRNQRDFGVCADVITKLRLPILGVCLGHQGIAHLLGGSVGYAPEPMHGRTSAIYHDGLDIFDGIPSGFRAVRYHSLMVDGEIPDEVVVNAWTSEGVPMAIRHRSRPLRGVQFHPESILTEHGHRLFSNFLALSRRASRRVRVTPGQPLVTMTDGTSPRCASQAAGRSWHAYARRVPLWLDPEAVFCHMYADSRHAFWLDSSLTKPGLSRFSCMGDASGPGSFVLTYDTETGVITRENGDRRTTQVGDIFTVLDEELRERACSTPDLPFEFNGGFVGWFGYGMKRDCSFSPLHPSSVPDAAFIFADRILVFDHEAKEIYLVALEGPSHPDRADQWFDTITHALQLVPCAPPVLRGEAAPQVTFTLRRDQEAYRKDIRECLREIREGESYEICLTNMITTEPTEHPLDLYRILRRASPAPYAAFLRIGDIAVLSSSPERFLRVGSDGTVSSKPIKGTAPRAIDPVEDQQLKDQLARSTKDSAENLMIVDLIRNDLARVCEVGSVRVPKLMDVESYATVHQLVSTVTGQFRPGVSAIACVRAAFPGGSMTGAPKFRTIEILDRLETGPRGIYSGSIGWLGLSGAADLNIVIRTAVVTPTETSFGVGGAIVALSDPTREVEECILKGAATIRSILLHRGSDGCPARAHVEGIPETVLERILGSQAPGWLLDDSSA